MRAIPRKRSAALAAAVLSIGVAIDYFDASHSVKTVIWATGFALLMLF